VYRRTVGQHRAMTFMKWKNKGMVRAETDVLARLPLLINIPPQSMKNQLTPPVDTAEFDDHVPSKLVTLLVSVRSPCAMTDVERRAEIASDTSVNMV
jgi:hypothetical protein